MVNIRGYISNNFAKAFLTIFIPFFLIVSLVFLVKIASLTSKIHISSFELITLYSYSLANILFYTIPLSFVAALANLFTRLSQENELIALYSLGINAKKILTYVRFLGLLFSVLLLTISFLAMPLSKQLYSAFKEKKKSEAQLNISAGKLGQKFGNYYIYIDKKSDKTFQKLVIYNRSNLAQEQFFSSQEGYINHQNNRLSLLLKKGYGYTYDKESLQQVKYQSLEVFDTTPKRVFHFKDILSYWQKGIHDKKVMHNILFFIFISLIPLLSIYMIAAFTMINPRYQTNHTYSVIFLTTFLFYLLASLLEKMGNGVMLGGFIVAIVLFNHWIFQKRVARYF
jgi:lipopolysaccharide export system permease protein